MNIRYLALPILACTGSMLSTAAAQEPEAAPYVTVDPGAFRPVPGEHNRRGVTVDPVSVRLITPGTDKFSIYNLIGPPHFGEGVMRTWNYVLVFPASPGSTERLRCRMEIRFEKPRGRYHVIVSEVVWQEQSCADRVAQAS
jgi:hypothetical protein